MKNPVLPLVLVAALGYFVDVFDLALFGIVRIQSLREIGIPESELLSVGVTLLNSQMLGLLLGGVIWGVLGDKLGRVKVLFGSILIYSLATLFNAFVSSPETYAVLRFIGGFGLAGELGAAITLVSEVLPKEKRGYGTAFVAGIGLSGAIAAGILAEFVSWRTTYFVGGVLGLLLLVLRFRVSESSLFTQSKKASPLQRGKILYLVYPLPRAVKYFSCIAIAVPIWFCAGILMTFAPELGQALHSQEPLSAGRAILFSYAGVAIGDVLTGMISQWMKSRKKVVLGALILQLLLTIVVLNFSQITPFQFYFLAFLMGLTTGYWAVFVTMTSEQFGTNLRATATTSAPNFVRAAVVPMTLFLTWLKPQFGFVLSSALIGGIVFTLALCSLFFIEETFAKDLNFWEN